MNLVLLCGLATQAATAAPSPSTEFLAEHVRVLASDGYEGRNSGYPGGKKAAKYLRDRVKAMGYEPIVPDYFQEFEFELRFTDGVKRATQNVVAFSEGTGPDLKHELVVIGAHYDHVGQSGQANPGRSKARRGNGDTIWNGADDNASGTAAVLEIARVFKARGGRARRSIMFVWFAAEEHGLWGSRHFVENVPDPFTVKSIAAVINLDMVGRNPDKPLTVGCVGTSDDWGKIIDGALKGVDLKIRRNPIVSSGSDQASFTSRKVPALSFFTGFHRDYHAPTDHADLVDYGRLERISTLGLRLLVAVADRKARPVWKGPARPKPRRLLGVNGEDIDEELARGFEIPEKQGGILVDQVGKKSVAEKGGLKKGDVIVEFHGQPLPRGRALTELRKRLHAIEAGVDVDVTILRGGIRKELTVRW